MGLRREEGGGKKPSSPSRVATPVGGSQRGTGGKTQPAPKNRCEDTEEPPSSKTPCGEARRVPTLHPCEDAESLAGDTHVESPCEGGAGGLRRPHETLPKKWKGVGRRLRTALKQALTAHPALAKLPDTLGATPAGVIPQEDVAAAANAVRRALGTAPWDDGGQEGYRVDILEAATMAAEDPEKHVVGWLKDGAPLGVAEEIPPSGIFPVGPAQEGHGYELGWSSEDMGNYRSFHEGGADAMAELQREVDRGYLEVFESRQEAVAKYGTVLQSKLGCIIKVGKKPRIVWDFRRSGANDAAVMPERVILPRVQDAVEDAIDLERMCVGSESVEFAVLGFRDAFKSVPLAVAERRYACACVGGRWMVATRLPFGAKGSPLVWARLAAAVMRSTVALWPDNTLRVETYVDDPILTIRGDDAKRKRILGTVVLWWLVLGAQLSWEKAQRGQSCEWIGVVLTTCKTHVSVHLPSATAQRLGSLTGELLAAKTVARSKLRSLAGKAAWAAGVIPEVRPFARCLWAAISGTERTGAPCVGSKRFKTSLRWLAAFATLAAGPRAPLGRQYEVRQEAGRIFALTTDASPWGLGATLEYGNKLIAYISSPISPQDAGRFGTVVGSHTDQSLWEGLAILVAVRAFRPLIWNGTCTTVIGVNTDSMAALGAGVKLTSKDRRLNAVFREMALDAAVWGLRFRWKHVAGCDNSRADALSRLYDPEPALLPGDCAGVTRVGAQSRGEEFWKTWCSDTLPAVD